MSERGRRITAEQKQVSLKEKLEVIAVFQLLEKEIEAIRKNCEHSIDFYKVELNKLEKPNDLLKKAYQQLIDDRKQELESIQRLARETAWAHALAITDLKREVGSDRTIRSTFLRNHFGKN